MYINYILCATQDNSFSLSMAQEIKRLDTHAIYQLKVYKYLLQRAFFSKHSGIVSGTKIKILKWNET